ncbi:hypothetical protein KR044_002938, partial [Drosophila immigrans]
LQNCTELNELQSKCGRYCFEAIKPILEYTNGLQNEVEDLKNGPVNLAEFNKSEKLLFAKIDAHDKNMEQTFEELLNATDATLQQIKSQDEKVEKKLQDLHKQIEVRNSKPGPPYQKIGSKYYYIEETEEVNWFGALHKCVLIGGHLASIKNLDEFNAIKENFEFGKHYWIDINDLAKQGEYFSVATGRKATYFNWAPGEPNNQNNVEHCGMFFSNFAHMMNDGNCETKCFYICE